MLNKAVLVFKAFRNLAPQYLKDLFICHNSRAPSRSIILPKPRIDLFKTSFSFAGASLWNSIPTHITSCSTLICFKTQLRKWFSFLPSVSSILFAVLFYLYTVSGYVWVCNFPCLHLTFSVLLHAFWWWMLCLILLLSVYFTSSSPYNPVLFFDCFFLVGILCYFHLYMLLWLL